MIDFLSTFPFRKFKIESEGYKAFASMIQLLKVLRIRKMLSTISHSNITIETKALTKIVFFSFLLCIYTHIIGCVMWFFLKEDYLWVAPTDFGNIRSRMQDPYQETDPLDDKRQIYEFQEDYDIFIFQWLSMWYHSALTLMLVEITARSMEQLISLIVVYIINAIFNAILFGIYFDLLQLARERQNAFQSEIDDANTAMTNLNLPERIKDQVRNYILQTHETKAQQQEYIKFSESMPPSKNQLLNALNFKKALNKSPNMIALRLGMRDQFRLRLKDIKVEDLNDPNRDIIDPNEGEKEFRRLIKKITFNLEVQHVSPEEIIIFQSEEIIDYKTNQFIDSKAFFYIILNGSFKVSNIRFNKTAKPKNKSQDGASLRVSQNTYNDLSKPQSKKLVSGDYFGEVSFLYRCRRTSTVKAKLYATVGKINHVIMTEMLRDFVDFKQHLKNEVVKIYDDDLKLFLISCLKKIDYLAEVPQEILCQIAYSCT